MRRHTPDDRRYLTHEERAATDPRYVDRTTERTERFYRERMTEERLLARHARKEGRTADYELHVGELRRLEAKLADLLRARGDA